jgi:hypothetical protein
MVKVSIVMTEGLAAFSVIESGAGADSRAHALVGGETGTGNSGHIGEPEGFKTDEVELVLSERYYITFILKVTASAHTADLVIGEVVHQPLSHVRLGFLEADDVCIVLGECSENKILTAGERVDAVTGIVHTKIVSKNIDNAHN